MRIIATIVTIFIIATNTLIAGVYNPDNIPLPLHSQTVNYVTNPDNILTQIAIDSINNKLLALEKEKGVKSLVIVVERIENDDPYDFAINVGNKYGVGNEQNTGLIIVLATLDRSYYILTGEGLEKFLPDALCKRIGNRAMVPHLKKSNWDSAIISAVDAIYKTLNGESELQYETKRRINIEVVVVIVVMICFLLVICLVAYISWKLKECPHCKKHTLKLINKEEKIINNGTKKQITNKYVCTSCGKEVTRQDTTDMFNNYGGGPFIGGSSGRGLGGFSGRSFGSFGRGSFGGGGAGGRF